LKSRLDESLRRLKSPEWTRWRKRWSRKHTSRSNC